MSEAATPTTVSPGVPVPTVASATAVSDLAAPPAAQAEATDGGGAQMAGKQKRRARKSIIEKKRFRQSMYDEADAATVTLSGYLGKKSGGLVGKYQMRFFELSGHYLLYYATKKKEDLLGTVDMDGATSAVQGGSANNKVKLELRADLTRAGVKGSME